jgi:hypothetical protein
VLLERLELQRPQRPFVRLLNPEITAYQTIPLVLLLAYDLVGNELRAVGRRVHPALTHHDWKKNARRHGRATFWA